MKTRPLSDEDKKLTAKEFAEKYAGYRIMWDSHVCMVQSYYKSAATKTCLGNVILGHTEHTPIGEDPNIVRVVPDARHGWHLVATSLFVEDERDEAQALLDKYAGKRIRVARAAITNSGCPFNAEKDEEFTILIKEKKNENEVLTEFCNNRAMGHGPSQNAWYVSAKDVEENIIEVLKSSDDL